MRLGTFVIPEVRLVPTSLKDIKDICTTVKNRHDFTDDQLAGALGYPEPKGGGYYRRERSLIYYGLIQSKDGKFSVTDLGDQIAFASADDRKRLYREAILNIQLWKELYDRFSKSLPDNLPVQLKHIAVVDLKDADKYATDIRRWYNQDIALISDEPTELDPQKLESNENPKTYSFGASNTVEVNKDIVSSQSTTKIQDETEEYSFENGKVLVRLPKENKMEIWKRVTQVLNIYLGIEKDDK